MSTSNQNNLPPEDYEFLRRYDEKLTKRNAIKKALRKSTPYRIRLKSTGEFITTASGKTIWSKIGAAKAGLRNDFHNFYNYNYLGGGFHSVSQQQAIDYVEARERKEAAYKEFLNNWVKFVSCPD